LSHSHRHHKCAFQFAEAKLGIIPGYGGTQRLPREIGQARALEAMLAGRDLSAAEALKLGLVNRVTDSADLMKDADQLAHDIAKLAPLAIRACLQAVTKGIELRSKKDWRSRLNSLPVCLTLTTYAKARTHFWKSARLCSKEHS
jgi:enoyl-CoA hydratase/carnithine racemase